MRYVHLCDAFWLLLTLACGVLVIEDFPSQAEALETTLTWVSGLGAVMFFGMALREIECVIRQCAVNERSAFRGCSN